MSLEQAVRNEIEATEAKWGETLAGAHRVSLADIKFSRGAQITIGMAVKDIAERLGLYPREVTSRLQGHMYWVEATENLMIIFPVPEIEADMLVEIPRGHWWFKGADVLPN